MHVLWPIKLDAAVLQFNNFEGKLTKIVVRMTHICAILLRVRNHLSIYRKDRWIFSSESEPICSVAASRLV